MEKIGRCGIVDIIAPKENLRMFEEQFNNISCLADEEFPFPVMEEKKSTDGDSMGYYIYLPPYRKEQDGYTYSSKTMYYSTWKKYCKERDKICKDIKDKGLVYCFADRKLHTKEEVSEKEKREYDPWGVFPHMRQIKSITYGK